MANHTETRTETRMVVGCRIEEYEQLGSRLMMGGALELQPLSSEQIDEYLLSGGPDLEITRKALQLDPNLAELAKSPLMLNVMTIAYAGVSIEDLTNLNRSTVAAHQEHLLEAYINKVVLPRAHRAGYTEENVRHWLSWLAKQMMRHSISVFRPDELLATWLPNHIQHALIWLLLSKPVNLPKPLSRIGRSYLWKVGVLSGVFVGGMFCTLGVLLQSLLAVGDYRFGGFWVTFVIAGPPIAFIILLIGLGRRALERDGIQGLLIRKITAPTLSLPWKRTKSRPLLRQLSRYPEFLSPLIEPDVSLPCKENKAHGSFQTVASSLCAPA